MTITLPVILKSDTPCRPELVSGSGIQFYEFLKIDSFCITIRFFLEELKNISYIRITE